MLIYAGCASDTFVDLALIRFDQLPQARTYRLAEEEPAPHGSILIFSSQMGRFPSRFARLVRKDDAERRSIVPPSIAHFASESIALKKLAEHLARIRETDFKNAMTGIHYQLLGQPQPATRQKQDQSKRLSGYHARRSREHHYFPL